MGKTVPLLYQKIIDPGKLLINDQTFRLYNHVQVPRLFNSKVLQKRSHCDFSDFRTCPKQYLENMREKTENPPTVYILFMATYIVIPTVKPTLSCANRSEVREINVNSPSCQIPSC